jgi:hypothetical protein
LLKIQPKILRSEQFKTCRLLCKKTWFWEQSSQNLRLFAIFSVQIMKKLEQTMKKPEIKTKICKMKTKICKISRLRTKKCIYFLFSTIFLRLFQTSNPILGVTCDPIKWVKWVKLYKIICNFSFFSRLFQVWNKKIAKRRE